MDSSERVLVKYPLFKSAIAHVQACLESRGNSSLSARGPTMGSRKYRCQEHPTARIAEALPRSAVGPRRVPALCGCTAGRHSK